MTTKISTAVRRSMRSNRSTRTRPERLMAAAVGSLGFTVVLNDRSLPGTPDVVVPSIRLAILVHGCFWHGCPDHWRPPITNRGYWVEKVRRNRERDKETIRALESMGWTAVEAWEHDVVRNPMRVAVAAIRESRR